MFPRKRSQGPAVGEEPKQKGPNRQSPVTAEKNPTSQCGGSIARRPTAERACQSTDGIKDEKFPDLGSTPVSKNTSARPAGDDCCHGGGEFDKPQQESMRPESGVKSSYYFQTKEESLCSEDNKLLTTNQPPLESTSEISLPTELDRCDTAYCTQLPLESAKQSEADKHGSSSYQDSDSDLDESDMIAEQDDPSLLDSRSYMQDTNKLAFEGGSLPSADINIACDSLAGSDKLTDRREKDIELKCTEVIGIPKERDNVVSSNRKLSLKGDREYTGILDTRDLGLDALHDRGVHLKHNLHSKVQYIYSSTSRDSGISPIKPRNHYQGDMFVTAAIGSKLLDGSIYSAAYSPSDEVDITMSECSDQPVADQTPKSSVGMLVVLDVGGFLYETTSATLSIDPGSLLCSLTTDSPKFPVHPSGYFHIDRDGRYFYTILEYLRKGTAALETIMMRPSPDKYEVAALLFAEGKFYELEEFSNNLTVVIFTSLLRLSSAEEHCLQNVLRIQVLDLGDETECFRILTASDSTYTLLSSVPHDYHTQACSPVDSKVKLSKISFAQFSWANLSIRSHSYPSGSSNNSEEKEKLFAHKFDEGVYMDSFGKNITHTFYYCSFVNMHFQDHFSADFCNLSSVLFRNCYFEKGADFTGSIMRGTRFVGCYGLIENGVSFTPIQAREAAFDKDLHSGLTEQGCIHY